MNEVVKSNPFGTVSMRNPEAMAQRMEQSSNEGALGTAPDGSEYLNFSGKRGVYEFGKDKEAIDPNERWVINIAAFEDGYIAWKGGRPVSTRLANIYTGVPVQEPAADEQGPFNHNDGEGWFKAKSMVLRSMDEDDKQGYFKINSKSGVAVIADLQAEVAARLKAGLDPWPVVCLGVEKFVAQGKTNFKPKLELEGWLSEHDLTRFAEEPDLSVDDLLGGVDADEPEPEPEPEPTPARRSRRRI